MFSTARLRSGLLSSRVYAAQPDALFEALTGRVAAPLIGYRNLHQRLMLHLPRLANSAGWVDLVTAEAELRRLHTLAELQVGPSAELASSPSRVIDVRDLHVASVPDKTVEIVHRDFHYLGSPRPHGISFGAYVEDRNQLRLAALATYSPLDVPTIINALPAGVGPEDVLVLSRMFAFDWAPRNTISWLLGQAVKELRRSRLSLRMLLTYLNPNLGFSGVSYHASNWARFGVEEGTRYAYLDDNYVTDRELVRLFGSPDDAPASRVTFSKMPLEPLELYVYAARRAKNSSDVGSVHLLRRPRG